MSNAIPTFPWARALCAAVLVAWLAAAPAAAQDAMATTSVPVTTETFDANNSITFSGTAKLKSRLAKDPEFGHPTLVMVFDLSGVVGKGAKKTWYVTSQEATVKPHAASQNVEFSVAVAPSATSPLSDVKTGVAKFALNVDIATGRITSAAGTVGASAK